jgi:hypothetical protein
MNFSDDPESFQCRGDSREHTSLAVVSTKSDAGTRKRVERPLIIRENIKTSIKSRQSEWATFGIPLVV